MSKMYEALQNPHFKKIWEKVIMNRHPEAENLNLALGSEYLQYPKECITITSQDGVIKEILGRPITLEDILIITKKHEFRKCDIDGKSQIRFFKTQTDLKYLGFDWQLTKPLHEQTPETWEKISNLID